MNWKITKMYTHKTFLEDETSFNYPIRVNLPSITPLHSLGKIEWLVN